MLRKQNEAHNIVSKVRCIFQEWKGQVQDKKLALTKLHSIIHVQEVKKGMHEIKSVASTRHYVVTRRQILNKLTRHLYIRHLKDGFSTWRSEIFAKHKGIHSWSNNEKVTYVDDVMQYQTSLSSQNTTKSFQHMQIFKSKQIFTAWLKISSQKVSKNRRIALIQKNSNFKQKKLILQKWVELKNQNKIKNNLVVNLRKRHQMQLKCRVLHALEEVATKKKKLWNKISNLQNKYDLLSKQNALQLISSFSTSRMACGWLQKGRATRSIVQLIS